MRNRVRRVAEQMFSDPREWLNSRAVAKLGISKDTLFSALRHKPGACRGGQESGEPLEFKRVEVLAHVVATWKPQKRRGSV
jgi:hypothetical protein